MPTKLRIAILAIVFASCIAPLSSGREASAIDGDTIDCRAMEVHAISAPTVTVVIFHQRDKQDQARLAAFLKQNSGAAVSVQAGGGDWSNATVFRMKSCFGRGLLILSAGALPMKDGATFRLKLSTNTVRN